MAKDTKNNKEVIAVKRPITPLKFSETTENIKRRGVIKDLKLFTALTETTTVNGTVFRINGKREEIEKTKLY